MYLPQLVSSFPLTVPPSVEDESDACGHGVLKTRKVVCLNCVRDERNAHLADKCAPENAA